MIKRSVMTLYSDPADLPSHQIRIVLAEKGVSVDILNAEEKRNSEDLAELNPYHSIPTLVDRDLVLFEPIIIMEYLDERFPHPPLMPVYPVARAKSRQLAYRIRRDWYPLVDKALQATDGAVKQKAQQEFLSTLLSLNSIFGESPFFLSEEFTLVDCVIAPILWRLPLMGVTLPKTGAQAILRYKDRVFARESFRVSLSEAEREFREAK
ncbi:MAG: stringent starvation protein A [Gammaproteobacteria bacterium RIFCSPHIGHO2_12_FULL_45_9]|nr:MAG: stringent starvation protein A [Gammaproteobacteria bacterium RIFCSPHIGHO2_12_FULL_45_9]